MTIVCSTLDPSYKSQKPRDFDLACLVTSKIFSIDSCLGISHIASGIGEPIFTHKPRLDLTQMGEAKKLVEMELDKSFPKPIVCDDKQGNMYMIQVEYTWIPSTGVRCGNLDHKEKICLLPPSLFNIIKSIPSETREDCLNMPEVNIDHLKPSSLKEKSDPSKYLLSNHTETSNLQKKMESTTKETTILQETVYPRIKEVPLSHSKHTLSPLAGESLAQTFENNMEEAPSNMVITY